AAERQEKWRAGWQRRGASKRRPAGRVNFIGLILIMASQGWAGACPILERDQGGALSQRGLAGGRTSRPRCGIWPPPIPGDHDHALVRPAAPILLRHRPARQLHAPVPPPPPPPARPP